MKTSVITSLAAVTVLSITASHAFAVSPAPSTSPVPTTASSSGSMVDKEVQDLKNKIANKVAELQKDQKAISGIITAMKGNTITIKTSEDAEYTIKRDETLTKIYQVGSTKKEINYTALEKGNYIIITGPLVDKSVDANTIYRDDQYIVKSGKIIEVNKDDYTVKVLTATKDNYILDIESKTVQYLMDIKTLDQTRAGFSKLKEGDVVHFSAKRTGTEKEANRYTAEKLLIIPQEYFIK